MGEGAVAGGEEAGAAGGEGEGKIGSITKLYSATVATGAVPNLEEVKTYLHD